MNNGEMKRLGDYIREVDVRNRDLEVTKLLGVSISKEFIPSIANTIGTDMSSYKIVKPRQFAYGPVTSRNGDKVSIALYKEDENAIISQAYTVFEVKNKQELLPEYLMMWFRRPEFDRYARFKSHGSAREIFSWEEMCDVELPVPPIEQQQKIVSEYEAVTRRIRLNERIIAKLEEMAQALYRKMFVDGIDKENLPEGWRMGTLGEMFELQRGFDLPSQDRIIGQFPIYASTGITGYNNQFKVAPPCIITGRSGTIGEVFFIDEKCWPLNTTLWVKDFKDTPPLFVYYKLKELELGKTIAGFAAVPTLNRNDVHMMNTIVPPKIIMEQFHKYAKKLYNHKQSISKRNKVLQELQSLLLAKMGE